MKACFFVFVASVAIVCAQNLSQEKLMRLLAPERDAVVKRRGSDDDAKHVGNVFIVQGGLSRLDDGDDVHVHVDGGSRKFKNAKHVVVKCENSDKKKKKCDSSSESRESKRSWRRRGYPSHDFSNLIHEYKVCPHKTCFGNKVALNPPDCFCGCGNYQEMRTCFDTIGHYTWDSEKCECISNRKKFQQSPSIFAWVSDLWDRFWPRVVD